MTFSRVIASNVGFLVTTIFRWDGAGPGSDGRSVASSKGFSRCCPNLEKER